jgi:TatD DNase family protein
MTVWIDTHCHLDAIEFGASAQEIRSVAATNGVALCVYPAVEVANFDVVRQLAHATGDAFALGIHPLYVKHAADEDLQRLQEALHQHRDDPRLVAVGEIGLDFFVPELMQSPLKERQTFFYRAQLKLARQFGLPVILHVRRSADQLLKGLRDVMAKEGADPATRQAWRGIAHAFNGSAQQAKAFINLGFKLGFGGALTYARATQLRRLASTLPLEAIVLETDAPDMPPHWLYTTAEQRALGVPQGRNSPGELPAIGAELAALRGISVQALSRATTQNALKALPRLEIMRQLDHLDP